MSALGEVLRDLGGVLDRRSIDWYLFGAQAVAIFGAPRATQDIDVTIRIERARLRELERDWEAAGFTHRFPEAAEDMLNRGAVVPLVHRRTRFDVDLVLAGSGFEDLVLAHARRISIAGVDVPVASPTHLLVMKVLAGRGKDVDDAMGLLASGHVDLADARSLLADLERALDQSDLLPQLDALVERSTRGS